MYIIREQDVSGSWRQLLEERAEQAVAVLSRVPGVIGLILSGSVGRGEAWPLSDVDLVILYEDGQEGAAKAVEVERLRLLDWWAAEGFCTTLDAGKLAFTRSEVIQTLNSPPSETAQQLGDGRWFHSLDKAYRSRAVFDSEGLAAALSDWFTEARFAPEVVRARLETHWRQVLAHNARATRALTEGSAVTAAVAMRESLHALTRYLIESWGGRDNSWARFGTRFEQTGTERNEGALVYKIMSLYGLSSEGIARRMALAPQGVRYRHALSLETRRLMGEVLRPEQDARDVLLVFATREVRYRQPPFEAWVGLETEPTALAERMNEYRRLLDTVSEKGDFL